MLKVESLFSQVEKTLIKQTLNLFYRSMDISEIGIQEGGSYRLIVFSGRLQAYLKVKIQIAGMLQPQGSPY